MYQVRNRRTVYETVRREGERASQSTKKILKGGRYTCCLVISFVPDIEICGCNLYLTFFDGRYQHRN